MPTYDVVIIGARVAGASLALRLARQGVSVALVDRDPFATNTLSTHFLWPRGVAYLRRLHLGPALAPLLSGRSRVTYTLDGVAIAGRVPATATAQRLAAVHGDAAGAGDDYACIRRQALDSMLVEAATAAGAAYFDRTEITDLTPGLDGGIGAAHGRAPGRRLTLAGRLFVAADGRDSAVARLTKAPLTDYRRVATAACWSYFSGIDPADVALAKTGNAGFGAAAASDGRTMVLVWGAAAEAARFARLDGAGFRAQIAAVLPAYADGPFAQAQRVEPFYRAADLHAFKRPSFRGNVVYVGDAASFKDQCTASGITHALRDSELAAAAIGQHLCAGVGLVPALTRYDETRQADLADYFEFACQAAAMAPATPDELALFRRMATDQALTDAFLAFCADSMPAAAFTQRLSEGPEAPLTRPPQGDSNDAGRLVTHAHDL